VDAAGYKSISSKRDVDAILLGGQQAACNNHIDTMGVLQFAVLTSPKGVCVEILACAMDPMQAFPAGRYSLRRRVIGRLPNYDQWSCPDKPAQRGVSPHTT
jgi:hypothetical protein